MLLGQPQRNSGNSASTRFFTTVKIGNQTAFRQVKEHTSTPTNLYDSPDSLLTESINRGKNVYMANCLSCHMMNGEGISGTFPPLAKSDYLMADSSRAIRVALYGQSDEITVNGVKYTVPVRLSIT